MFRRRGVTLTKALLTAVCMLAAPLTQAISVGNLTFSLPSETDFVSKRVVNNNKSARIYRIAISAIDSPGSSELRTRPVDGELLFGFCRINGGNASKIWPYRLFSLPVNKTVPQVTFHHLPDVDIVLCVSCESARCRPEWSVPGETI